MAQTKHTPGPWKYYGAVNSVIVPNIPASKPEDQNHYKGKLICESVWDEANGKLLAAAPEMVNDLQDEVDFLQALIDDEINKLPVTVRSTMRFRIIELKKTIKKATE